jgi:ATP sulfurylase
VGFHTRNVAHRAHEYLQLTALETRHCDVIFIHPIIGTKKSGDFSRSIILKTYEHLIKNFYPAGKAVLGGFASYSRYAGPREALFTALCRKNFCCSHFIIGRDHTGVDGYYSPSASQRLWDQVGGIGIEPVLFDEVYHCEECGELVERCRHGLKYSRNISGTAARNALMRGETLPDWHMREPLTRLILGELHKGGDVFVP